MGSGSDACMGEWGHDKKSLGFREETGDMDV